MGQKQEVFQGSLAVAEAARDKAVYTGFLAGLFQGDVRWNLVTPKRIPGTSPTARELLERFKTVLASLDPDQVDRDGEVPGALLTMLADAGGFGIKIPKRFGGLELSQSEYQQVATLCGSLDASLTVLLSAAQSIGVPEPLHLFGTEEQKATYLPRLAKGEISGFALTEKGAGCDIAKVETYAVRVKKQGRTVAYRLTGEKFFITNSAKQHGEFLASLLLVIARIVDRPEEIQDVDAPRRFGAFIVETRWPGCSVRRLRFEGVRGIYNGAPSFEGVYVPVENRLGSEEDGLRIALSTLTVGRLTLPAACLGGVKQGLSLMRGWAAARVQWNRPIGEHTLIGRKLCRAAGYALALEALMNLCGAWADAKDDLRLESAAVKILGSEWHWEVLNDLFQVRGGRGFMTVESQRESCGSAIPAMRMLRDARINMVWEGTNEILRMWIAREALAPYIDHGLDFLQGTPSRRMQAPLFYAHMALRGCLPLLQHGRDGRGMDPEHARWMRVIETEARRLTRWTVTVTLRHRQTLVHKQLLLQDLVNESLALFAMAATVWYASQDEMRGTPGLVELTTFFCQDTVDRLALSSAPPRFSDGGTKDRAVYRLAPRIMRGEYAWLEDGIVPLRTSDDVA